MEAQKTAIKEYATKLDSTVEAGDLLDIVTDLTVDRVLLYLNETELAENLERIVAQVVATNYHAIKGRAGGVETSTSVSRVEDNGQSVTYKENAVKHFSGGDDAVFGSFTGLLAPYRRIHVIT